MYFCSDIEDSRFHVPVLVPFRKTSEPGTSLEFRMAPAIQELSPRANDASMEHRGHVKPHMTSIDVLPGILTCLSCST